MSRVVIDFDPTIWVSLDPEGAEPDVWAVTTAQTCWADTGVEPTEDEIALLSARLLLVQQEAARLAPMALLHLPSPDLSEPTGPLALLTAFDAGLGDQDSLAELAGASDPLLLEPAQTRWLPTQLGQALRCRRFSRAQAASDSRLGGPVFLAYSYAWHLPEAATDLRLICTSNDVAAAARLEDDFDHLAEAVQLR